MEDLRVSAKILRNRKVHPSVRLIISPPSQEIYLSMVREGLIDIFVQADAVICPPNCAACAGGHMGILGAGEVCLSSSTLNLKGRMGSPESEICLANSATIAASAIEGKIADPRKFL